MNEFSVLARYNQWAGVRLSEDLAALPPMELTRSLPVDFGSILGILNHLVLADMLWLSRFTGQGPTPGRIDDAPCPDLPSINGARRALDARIMDYVRSLPPDASDAVLQYRDTKGSPHSGRLGPLLMHFFNHQTHHRGQVHALASMAGCAPRNLDLLYFYRETGA